MTVNNWKVTVYNAQNPNGFDTDAGQEYSKSIKTTPGNVEHYRHGQPFKRVMSLHWVITEQTRLIHVFFGPVDSDVHCRKVRCSYIPTK